ncbi:MAG: outer membrane protein assembly factor BamD [Gammaproteobacteria bacterium]|nr:outer membrane protein assembly factor BamD [Gammaproteobacteria bacterium]
MSVEKRKRVLPGLCLKFGALALITLLAGACSSDKYERDRNAASDTLFQKGTEAMSIRNYSAAIFYLEQLGARYPFSENAKQAQLNLLYVYYKNDEPESAIDAADNFIRENPTHPRVDYAYYIKGLVNFPKESNSMERLFRANRYSRPPKGVEDSFSAFATLIERFPGSLYAPDARERMIFLRNRLAQYQIYVAEWYVRRGSYVAASHRARSVLEEYAGSTSAYPAIEMLALCYNRLGLTDLEASARELLTRNQDLKNASKPLEQ